MYYDGNRRLQDPFDSRSDTVGAPMIIRVRARAIFPNSPRYIPAMQLLEPWTYVPRPGVEPREPAWRSFPDFQDCVQPRQPTAKD